MATAATVPASQWQRRRQAPARRPNLVVAPQERAPRRSWRRAAWTMVLVALALGGVAGWHGWQAVALFPLQAVRVTTPLVRVGEADLRAAVAPHVHGGMLRMDVNTVRQAIEALPWVASASVRRAWPASLELSVVEEIAQARWNEDGVLNPAGVAFHPPAETIPAQLPVLAGPPGSEREVMARFHELDALLAPLELHVVGLERDQRLSWTATLDNDIELQLGSKDGLEAVRRFARVYPQVVAQAGDRSLAAVDLRYPNGFALRWRSSASE